MSDNKPISFVFFGTGPLAESVLASLVREGHMPKLVVTKPDSPQGRHMVLTPPYIKTWADMKKIPVLQPEKLNEEFNQKLKAMSYDLFIVASYGKMIPDSTLSIPEKGILNVHPSLLPLYRGPSPIESSLLHGDETTGVTIIKLDNEMDHGPILIQNAFPIPPQSTAGTLEVLCGQMGGELLTQILQSYVDGSLIPKEQDHSKVTLCKKITKDLGEITLDTSYTIVRSKYRALTPWPSLYFFINHHDKRIRVKVTDVDLTTTMSESSTAIDVIRSVTPEGKKEMDWKSFERGYMNS
jgi:methionyl-tRNA formyltransferase